jgi:RHS repeat-associated protein
LSLAAGASATVKVSHSIGGLTGSGRLTLAATGEGADNGYYNVTITSFLSLASYNSTVRKMSECVASCFNNIWSHSTPAYFSLDQPRAFALVYNSATARPTPVVTLDVTPVGTPTHYEAQLRRASDNVLLTLANGSTSAFYSAGSQATRIAVAVDTRTNGSWMANAAVNVTVTAHYAASSPISNTLSTQLRFLDRTQSNAFGAGFWPAGIQRYYGTTAGPLVVEGDGSQYLYAGGATPGGTSARFSTHTSTTVRRVNLDGSYVEFDVNTGLPNKAADRFGNTTVYTWNGVQLLTIADPMGKTTSLTYDANGNLATVTDPAGRVTRYTINASGQLIGIEDPDNVSTTLGYNSLGLLTSMTNRGGKTWDYAYDELNRLLTTTAPSIALFSGGTGRPVTTFRSADLAIWQPALAGTSAATAKGPIVGDTTQATVTDPLGAVTKFKLNGFGASIRIVDALAQVTTIQRDTMGRPTQLTEPNNHTVRWLWGSGNEATLNFSKYLLNFFQDLNTGRLIQYQYNNRNDVTTIFGGISEDVVRMNFTYHNGGPRGPAGAVDTIKAGGRVSEIHTFDSRGRDSIVAHGDISHKSSFFYDATWGNRVRSINPRGNTTRRHFDGAGRADSFYTADNKVWSTSYHAMNNIVNTRDPLGNLTLVAYNADLTIKRILDPKGQVYRYAYNALGAMTDQFDLADTLLASRMAYDSAGRLRTVTNRRSQSITMAYDQVGRLRSRSGSSIMEDTYRYDPGGRWMVATNAVAYDSLVFDLLGNLDREFQRINGRTYEFRYRYDRQNRATSRVLYLDNISQARGTSGWTYNGAGDLTWTSAAITLGLGREPVEGLGNTWTVNEGAADSWFMGKKFNENHQVVRDSFGVAQLDTLFKNDVSYDVRDRISQANAGGYPAFGIAFQDEYRYDDAGRLVQAQTRSSQGACGTEYGLVSCSSNVYSYDPAGNRTDPLANAVIGAGNRTQQFRGESLSYDLDGNVTSKVGNGRSWTYAWDAAGQLLEVKESGAVVSTFAYDALGRRVMRTRPGGAEWYLYDGQNVVLDLDNSMAMTREYLWYPGTDRLLSVTAIGTWKGVAINDQRIGDAVRGIADADGGAVLKRYLLTAWGGLSADTGTIVRIQMAGREYDQETGLYYMRARYYDPKLGRFLSEDPLGLAGGMNLYAYAGNDPINFYDPNGLEMKKAPPPEGRPGGGGGSGIWDPDNDGRDNFDEFADYSWGLQLWRLDGGTVDQYHWLTFVLDHGFINAQTESELRQALYFGDIEPRPLVINHYAEQPLDRPHIHLNVNRMWNDNNPQNFAFLMAHELYHVKQRAAGIKYPGNSEEISANCFAQRQVGTHHPNMKRITICR